MIGKTFYFCISFRFIKILIGVVLSLAFLKVTVDFIAQLPKTFNVEDASLLSLYTISLLRVPAFIEKTFPFACLFTAMMTLTQLNLKVELVVARAASVVAPYFLLLIKTSKPLMGVLIAKVYASLTIHASNDSEDLTASITSKIPNLNSNITQRGCWIKQQDENGGSTVTNAQIARQNGKQLDSVSITRFGRGWTIIKRLDVKQAIHLGNTWLLNEVIKTDTSGNSLNLASMKLKTRLTEGELLGIISKPENVLFWKLKETVKRVEESGTNGKPRKVQFDSLTALALRLLAIVIIAATICLQFMRFKRVRRMILSGIFFGFVLYIFLSLILTLGSNGIVPPALAAWAPGFVATLFGMSVLLHREDG